MERSDVVGVDRQGADDARPELPNVRQGLHGWRKLPRRSLECEVMGGRHGATSDLLGLASAAFWDGSDVQLWRSDGVPWRLTLKALGNDGERKGREVLYRDNAPDCLPAPDDFVTRKGST